MRQPVPHYFLYGELQPSAELEMLHIETIAERNIIHHWEIDPHRHDSLYQLVWVEQGRMEVRIDSDEVSNYYGPTLLCIPPSVVHGFRIQSGTLGRVITIATTYMHGVFGDKDRALFGQLLSGHHAISLDMQQSSVTLLSNLLRRLDDEYRWPRRARAPALGALLKLIFVELLRVLPHDQLKIEQNTEAIVQFERFQKLIEHHLREQWSVQQYTHELGISEKRLNRCCKEVADLKPLQIIHQRVINEAKRYLVYTNMSVNEIALDLGFKEPAYFSKFFNKVAGIKATEFRQEYRDRDN